ncbi:MAG: hypothetical protein IT314_02795 [Anaerolineales bacterium]|nr:hypothetical protein [Anaerolineales bacterium]
MGDTPFYKRPWFFIAGWLVFLLVAYFWDIFKLGGIRVNEVRIFIDIICAFPFLLVIWMAFFSQFVLPVHTFSDRQKIFSRLIARLFGSRGPAIFIKNGIEEKEPDEEKRKGPGVLWLDSASGAVTRTATKIKQTLGPGVHFTDAKETIDGTVDLHRQSHTVGPTRDDDDPFAEKKEEQSEETYNQIQDRRKQVSALTRDGIEIVPNINVTFRVNTGFPETGQPGSRFGYRIGITAKGKLNEAEDQKAIRNAVLGEGINPYYKPENPRYRMAWNQLPAALAIDVWREYAAKFTLEEFFIPSQEPLPVPPKPLEPTEEEIDPLTQAIQVGPTRDTIPTALARILRLINILMSRLVVQWEKKETAPAPTDDRTPPYAPPPPPEKKKSEKKTAFEIVNEMVKARLTQPTVDLLGPTGQRVESHNKEFSQEFDLLQKRGLVVLSVSVSNLRLNPIIDKERIEKWQANWLASANLESDQHLRMRNLFETEGQEQAMQQFAKWLGEALAGNNPADYKQALKTLLLRTRSIIIRIDQLRRKMSSELQEVEDIIRWIEVNGK